MGGKEREKANGGIAVPLPLELDGQRGCVFDSERERERERDAASNEREEERASDQALPKPRRYYTCIRRLSNSNGWPMQIAACSRALYVLMGQWHRATSVQ